MEEIIKINDVICRYLDPDDKPSAPLLIDLRYVNTDHPFGEADSYFTATALLIGNFYFDIESYDAQLAARALWTKGLARRLIGMDIGTIIKADGEVVKTFILPDCIDTVEIDITTDESFLVSLHKESIITIIERPDLEGVYFRKKKPVSCMKCLFFQDNRFCKQYLYDIPKNEDWAVTCPGGIEKPANFQGWEVDYNVN